MGFLENRRGIPPSYAAARAALPAALAADLCLTGRLLEAEEAQRLGVVDRGPCPGGPDAARAELAGEIAAAPPSASIETKRRILIERATCWRRSSKPRSRRCATRCSAAAAGARLPRMQLSGRRRPTEARPSSRPALHVVLGHAARRSAPPLQSGQRFRNRLRRRSTPLRRSSAGLASTRLAAALRAAVLARPRQNSAETDAAPQSAHRKSTPTRAEYPVCLSPTRRGTTCFHASRANPQKSSERGSQDSNLESPVLETGALANLATAPRGLILVRAEGVEPPRSCEHRDLNPACLPVPARPQDAVESRPTNRRISRCARFRLRARWRLPHRTRRPDRASESRQA